VPLQSFSDTDATVRLFRARIFKPTEGVFLFHPRALERLIAEHLATHGYELSIPALNYYLMPAAAFLSALELENPEALAVIEGLSLPTQVILLPQPLQQRLDAAGFTRLLRDYWARRFEGEIARTWQAVRDAEHAEARPSLETLIGAPAYAEIRELLTRDGVMPAGLNQALVTRSFVALITRLHHFSPGGRGFFFPAIQDWAALDAWIRRNGLILPPAPADPSMPALLLRIRPDDRCGTAAHPLRLPTDLPYGQTDVGFHPQCITATAAPPPPAPLPSCIPTTACPLQRVSCLATQARHEVEQQLQQVSSWQQHFHDVLLALCAPLLDWVLALNRPFWWRSTTPALINALRVNLALLLFRHALRCASRAERSAQFATVIEQFAAAQRRLHQLDEPCASVSTQVTALLLSRRQAAETILSARLADTWRLNPESAHELSQLVQQLSVAVLATSGAWTAHALLRDLERVLLESRTTYYNLRPLSWLLHFGKTPLRQLLPFQANLKALRLLDTSQTRLEQLGWAAPLVERFHQPLHQLARHITAHLEQQLKPHLQQTLIGAGFQAHSHREAVAAHKLLRELLDVIEHRRHLKFTDVRDIIARNQLRLPEFSRNDLCSGDRLARFDRAAARALPGVYKPGEFYLKGLQQLSAPLFGTALGRVLLSHFILPFGLAFLGLKTLHVVIAALSDYNLDLTPLWLVGAVGLLINIIIHAHLVRTAAWAVLRGLWWGLRLLFYDGLRRLLRWQPLISVLETNFVRGIDRHLLRPFFIGALLVVPFIAFDSLLKGELAKPEFSVFALALALGTLVRNTPAGRHLLDDTASGVGRVLRIVNQTLILGLVRELMQFFKEVTRRFQQSLHWIEELLSHRLGESHLELVIKALLIPLWRLLDFLIQFYVTVLVEPQINPIKHFPLVTIGHKLMLPFFPLITSFLITITATILPKWIAYPLVTLTVLLLPGLAGFLVWELKENWKLYAANHQPTRATGIIKVVKNKFFQEQRNKLAELKVRWQRLRFSHLLCTKTSAVPLPTAAALPPPLQVDCSAIELAIIGHHGETMRGLLQRGFHSGTLPKAFDRLRRVLRNQIRTDSDMPQRLRDAQRHLAEIERAICVFCERELAYALRRRCQQEDCALAHIETQRPRLATASFELTVVLRCTDVTAPPLALHLSFFLVEPDLFLTVTVRGAVTGLEASCWNYVQEDLTVFSGRAGAQLTILYAARTDAVENKNC
jgi:hypothetical protein